MHSVAYLVVRKDDKRSIDEIMDKFYECNENYYELDYYDSYTAEEAGDDKEYMTKYIDEFTGEERYAYQYNPYALYDWYEIGGRWDGFIPTVNGKANQAIVKDIVREELREPACLIIDDEFEECDKTLFGECKKCTEKMNRLLDGLDKEDKLIVIDYHY